MIISIFSKEISAAKRWFFFRMFFAPLIVITFIFLCTLNSEIFAFITSHKFVYFTIILIISLSLSMICAGLLNYFNPRRRFNLYTNGQISELELLIRRCKKSIFLFAGQFHSSVYDSDEIISALKCIPDDALVELYFLKSKVDQKSGRFLKLVEQKGWKLERVTAKGMRHFAIVDGRHLRIEVPNGKDSGPQFAKYFYGRPDFVKVIKKNFGAKLNKAKQTSKQKA